MTSIFNVLWKIVATAAAVLFAAMVIAVVFILARWHVQTPIPSEKVVSLAVALAAGGATGLALFRVGSRLASLWRQDSRGPNR